MRQRDRSRALGSTPFSYPKTRLSKSITPRALIKGLTMSSGTQVYVLVPVGNLDDDLPAAVLDTTIKHGQTLKANR